MAQNVSSALVLAQITGTVTDTFDLMSPTATFEILKSQALTNGTGNDQINYVWSDAHKIAIGGSKTYDLSGSDTGPHGNTLALTTLKVLAVRNVSPDNSSTAQVSITTNGIGFMTGTTPSIKVPAGDVLMMTNLRAGWTITNTSADTITVTNDDSFNGAWIEFMVAGVVTDESSSSSSLSSLSSSSSSSPSSSSSSSP